ncbi:MAG: DUF4446 family protein [Actinobacteria bacterium]|nr:DUF4446 family protein [Actinomycetota bacterium]
MPDLTTQQLSVALAVVAGVALVSLLVTLALALRLRRFRRTYATVRVNRQKTDILAALGDTSREVAALDQRVDGVLQAQEQLASSMSMCLKNFALVRFDAFEDMGGRLSFAAAWLDGNGDGIVLTSINGRTETRSYAKQIKGLSSSHNLSDEERDALEEAMAGNGRAQSPVGASS